MQIPFARTHYRSLWERSGSALFRDKDEKVSLSESAPFSFFREKVRSQNASKASQNLNLRVMAVFRCSIEGASGGPPGGLPRALFT